MSFNWKKVLSMIMAIAMIISVTPINALGAEAEGTTVDSGSVVSSAPTQVEVATLDELQAALADNSNNLPIVVTASIEIPAGVTAVLDLNGKTITSGYQADSATKHIYPLDVYGDLTIKDTVGGGSISGRGIYVQNGSKLTVESGAVYGIDDNGGSALYQYGGDIVINGGLIEQKADYTYNYAINAGGGTVTVNGGKVVGKHGALAVSGAAAKLTGGELICTGNAGWTDNVVYVSAGSFTMTGGTVLHKGQEVKADSGAGVVAANDDVTIAISGGSVTGLNGALSGNANTTVTGGTFIHGAYGTNHYSDVSEYVPEGYEYDAETGTVVKETPAPSAAVFTVTMSGFLSAVNTLEDALNVFDQWAANMAILGYPVITLNEDYEMTAPVVVDNDYPITINLNGHSLIYNGTVQGEAMITNKGDLTINDSVGGGEIYYNYTGAADSTYSKGNYTISNAGTLTVNGGKIHIANLSGHAKYPIDNNSTTGNAVLVINGGHLYNYNTSAIRQFCNSTTNTNSVTITGGLIEGYSAIWMQNPGSKTVNGALSITGGEVKSTAKAYVNGTSELKDVSSKIYCSAEGGAWSESSAVSITGGTINENVFLAEEAPAAITIGEGATFNGNVELPAAPANYVAQIGETGYETLEAAFAAAGEGDTITLLTDAAPVLTSQSAITKAAVINLNGNTLTLAEDDLYFGTTTFTNGKIVVYPSVKASTAVFWMFEGQTLTFDNVDIVATGVTGTYLIGINGGTGSAVKLLNGSKITIANDTQAGLTAVICDNGSGNSVVIDGCDIDVAHIEGRFYLGGTNGSITVNDSTVDLNGVKEGFYLRAGQTLAINGTSVVNVVLNDTNNRYGINLSSDTATYTKADTATVNATDNVPAPVYVAYIGETGYESLADAVAAAQSGATILLKNGEYELPLFSGKELTFKGESKDGVVVNDAPDANTQGWLGSTFHFENLTAKGATANYHGLANGVVAVTYKDCNINGLRFLYAKDVSFEDCAFNANGVEHSFWTYGASNITVKNCTFTYTDRAVNCYSENGADHETDIAFTGCTFTYAGTADAPEGAVEINSGSVKSIDLTMDGCTAPAKGAMWFNSQWDGKKGANTTVVVDGEKVWPIVIEIYDWEDLKELDALVESGNMLEGATVKLMNDIDLYEMGTDGEPVSFNPIGANSAYFKGTFDGQGHTIKNMYQSGWALGYDWYNYGTIGLFAYLWDATVKNLTIENAECFVEGGNVAGIAGCAWGNCTFENITIKNSTYATYNDRAAGIVGYTGGEGTMTFKNVTVDKDTVIAALWGSYDCTLGGVVGSTQSPTKFHFEDVNVACKLDCYNDVTASYKWYSYRMCGMLIGRMNTLQENSTDVDPRGIVTIKNVNVTIGEWATHTYIWDDSLSKGCQRVEPGYTYGGVDVTQYPDAQVETLGFSIIIGGPQSQSKGYYGSDITKLEALEGFDTSTLTVEDKALEIRSRVAQVGDKYYTSLQDAIDNANGGEITLLVDVTENITIADNATVVLDLNGKTLTGYIAPCKPTSLTVKNGSIVNTNASYSAIEINAGELVLENVNVSSARHGVRIDGAVTATINGGEYKSVSTSGTRHAVNVSGAANVTIKAGTFVGPKGTTMDSGSAVCVQAGATVTIEGGNFSKGKNATLGVSGTMIVKGGTFDQNPSAYVPAGYVSEKQADGTYTVRELKDLIIVVSPVATMSTTTITVATMDEAVAYAQANPADSVTYQIAGPVELTTGYSHGILDLGKNVAIEGVTADAKLTIVGGGVPDIKGVTFKNITIADEGDYLTTANEFMYQNFIDCTFVNVTFEDGIRVSGTTTITGCTVNANTANEYAIWMDEGNFTMTNTTVTAGNDAYGLLKSDAVDTITLTGNTFEYLGNANKEALNVKGAKITATNNTFIDCAAGILPADKTNYAADGTTVIDDAALATDNTIKTNVAKIGDKKYETIAEAVAAAKAGDTVDLLGNSFVDAAGFSLNGFTLANGSIAFKKGARIGVHGNAVLDNVDLTFDMDGTSGYPNTAIYINGGSATSLTLKNGSNVLIKNPGYTAIYNDVKTAYALNIDNSTLTIEGKGTSTGINAANITLTNGAALTTSNTGIAINGGSVNVDGNSAVTVNGTSSHGITNVVLTVAAGGKVDVDDCAYLGLNIQSGSSIAEGATVTVNNCGTAGNYVGIPARVNGTTGEDQILVDNQKIVAKGVSGNAFTSIDAAIKAAKAGETVTILAGEYNTNLNINKAITVVGETDAQGNNLVTIKGQVSVSGNGATVKNLNIAVSVENKETALYINGGNILIEGCNISGYNVTRYSYVQAGGVTFKNCVLDGYDYTLHFDTLSGDLTIDGCTLDDWSAIGAGGNVIVKNSTFKVGESAYNTLRTWTNATYDNCTFEKGFDLDLAGSAENLAVTNSKFSDGTPVDITLFRANDTEKYNITVDGVKMSYAAKIGNTYYKTIADAIKAANAGDEVFIFEGIYEGNLDVNKAITVVGETTDTGYQLVEINGKLNITADGATVKGLYVYNTGNAGYIGAKDVLIEGCEIASGSSAFRYCYTDGTVTFKNSVIAGSVYGIHFDGSDGGNIVIDGCKIQGWTSFAGTINKVTIKDTEFADGNYDQLRFYQDAELTNVKFNPNMSIDFGKNNVEANFNGCSVTDGSNLLDVIYLPDIAQMGVEVKVDNVPVVVEAMIGDTAYLKLSDAFAAAKDGDEVKIYAAGTYKVPTGKNITITGAVEGVKFDMSKAVGVNASMTFNNVTFEYGNANYVGLQHAGTMVYNNCTINGQVFLYGTSETFNNCTFNQISSDAYNVWTYGAKEVEFNGCTFNSAGKSVLIYAEGASIFNDVTVTDCDFIASAAVDGKAAIEMDSSLTSGINLTIDGATTATGFGSGNVSDNSLWNNKKGSNTDANNDITVVVDGVTVLAPVTFVAKIGDTGYTTIADAIKAANAGDTVTLLADVTVNSTVKITKSITLDGNNHKISGTASPLLSLNSTSNITVQNAVLETTGNVVRWNYVSEGYTHKYLNCQISGGVYGIHYDGSANGEVVIEGCTLDGFNTFAGSLKQVTVKDTIFDANQSGYAGANFFGHAVLENVTLVDDGKTTWLDVKSTAEVTGGKVVKDGNELSLESYLDADAKIGSTYYNTLTDALSAAQAGETVILLADVEASEVILIDKSLTINGNGHKVTSSATRVFRVTASNVEVTLNDVNMVSTAVRVGTNDVRGLSVDNTANNARVTLNNCSVDFADASANDWAYAVNQTGANNVALTINGGTYEGANVINVHGANNTIVVKDATLTSLYPDRGGDYEYGACIWVLQENGSSVEATGNTFNGSNAIAFNVGTGTAVTESNNTDNTTLCVAQIGTTYYTSLKAAFEAAQDGDTIKLLHNIDMTEMIVNTKKVTLDLNGKTITGTDTTSKNFSLIDNRSELTITGNGKMTLTATVNSGWNRYSAVIANNPGGKLVIENGTFEHLGGTDMAYGIDNLTNGKGTYAETVINGGTIKSTYRAIRQFLNGVEAQNILTINGGTIEGANKSIWMQDPSAKANTGKLTVSESAKLIGDVYLYVTPGSTEWPVEVSIAAAALDGNSTVLTGNVPYGYVVENANGTWGVRTATYVAKIGEVGYESLADAITDAEAGDTIVFLADINENVTVSKNLTIDGANFKYTGTMTVNTSLTVTVQNVKFVKGCIMEAKGTGGNLTVMNCDFDGVDETIAYAVTMRGGSSVTVVGGTVKGYDYGFLYVPSAVTNVTVKNVTVEGMGYGVHVAYGSKINLENVKMDGTLYGIQTQNYGAKTITLKNCSINATNGIYVWERNTTVSDTFVFEGVNEITGMTTSKQAVLKAATIDGTNLYGDLVSMVNKADNDQTVKLLGNVTLDGSKTVTESQFEYDTLVYVNGKTITIDFNGYTVEVTPNFTATSDKGLTGTIEAVIFVGNGANLTLKDSSVEQNGGIKVNKGTALYSLIYNAEATLTVENGVYNVAETGATGSLIYGDAPQKTTIKGGSFTLGNVCTVADTTKPWIFNVEGKNADFIEILGGTYNQDLLMNYGSQKDCEVLIPRDLALKDNGNKTWTIVDAVAYVGTDEYNNGYATLAEAIAAAANGETVTLLKDVTVTDTVIVDKTITLDLNGNNIENTGSAWVLKVDGNSVLTLTDSSAEKDGTIVGTKGISVVQGSKLIMDGGNINVNGATGAAIQVYGSEAVMNGGKITAEYGAILIYSNNDVRGTFTMNGGEMVTKMPAIYAQGTDAWDDVDVTINDGKITSETAAIYWPAAGKLTIKGGELTGKTAVYVKSGSLEITGGKLTATGDKADYAYMNSGFELTGDALVIENVGGTSGYQAVESVVVSGGTFVSAKASAVASYAPDGVTAASKFISGGVFSSPVAKAYCAEGYVPADNGDGTYGVKLGSFVAQIGENKYESLAEALAEAKSGDTVVLIADTNESMIILKNGATLDLNGFNLETDYFITLSGTQVLNSKTTGILKVPQTGLSLQMNNTYVPVWNGVDGYYLVEWGYGTQMTVNNGTTSYYFIAKPRNNGVVNTEVVKLLQNGASDNNLSIVVNLYWANTMGTYEQTFTYNDTHIGDVYTKNPTVVNTGVMFYLDVTGYEQFDSVTMHAAVVATTGQQDAANLKTVK